MMAKTNSEIEMEKENAKANPPQSVRNSEKEEEKEKENGEGERVANVYWIERNMLFSSVPKNDPFFLLLLKYPKKTKTSTKISDKNITLFISSGIFENAFLPTQEWVEDIVGIHLFNEKGWNRYICEDQELKETFRCANEKECEFKFSFDWEKRITRTEIDKFYSDGSLTPAACKFWIRNQKAKNAFSIPETDNLDLKSDLEESNMLLELQKKTLEKIQSITKSASNKNLFVAPEFLIENIEKIFDRLHVLFSDLENDKLDLEGKKKHIKEREEQIVKLKRRLEEVSIIHDHGGNQKLKNELGCFVRSRIQTLFSKFPNNEKKRHSKIVKNMLDRFNFSLKKKLDSKTRSSVVSDKEEEKGQQEKLEDSTLVDFLNDFHYDCLIINFDVITIKEIRDLQEFSNDTKEEKEEEDEENEKIDTLLLAEKLENYWKYEFHWFIACFLLSKNLFQIYIDSVENSNEGLENRLVSFRNNPWGMISSLNQNLFRM